MANVRYFWKVEHSPSGWGGECLTVEVKESAAWGAYPIRFKWTKTGMADNWYLEYQQVRTMWTADMRTMSALDVRLAKADEAMRPHPVAVIQKLERMTTAARVVYDPRLNQEIHLADLAPDGWGAWCEDVEKLEPPEDEAVSWHAYCRVMAPDEARARRQIVADLATYERNRDYRLAFLKAGEPVTCFGETEAPLRLHLPDVMYDPGMIRAWIEGEETPPTIEQVIDHFEFRATPEWLVELMLEIEVAEDD